MNRFDNLNELEAQVSSLPGAEMRAIHLGKQLEKSGKPKDLKQDLKDMSLGASKVSEELDFSPETNAVAVVNKETGNLATTGTVQYDIVNHQEAFQPVVESLRDLGVSVDGQIRARDGKNRVLLQAMTDREFEVNGEKYGVGFQVKNTYNKSGSVVLRGFMMRLKCSNQMIASNEMIEPLKRQHRGDVDILEEYKEWMQKLVSSSSEFRQVLANAMEDLFDKEDAIDVLVNAGFPKGKVLDILELVEPHEDQPIEVPEGKVSRKQLYDACTNYITHELEGVAFTTEERYQSWANNILTLSDEDLLIEVHEDDRPISDDQETLETVERAMEVTQ